MSRSVFISLLFIFAVASHATGFDVDSLLLRSVGGLHGYQTISSMTSFRAVGRIDLNGLIGRFEEVVVPPNQLYFRLTFPDFSLTQAYDGREAWQEDINERVSVLSGFELRELIRSTYFETFSHVLPGRLAGAYQYWGDTTVQGEDLKMVLFFPLLSDTTIVGFDAATGLRRITISKMDDLETVATNEQYQLVDGVPISFEQRAVANGAPLNMLMQVDSAAFNQPVDRSIFTRPDKQEQGDVFPSEHPSIEIPFTYVDGHIFLVATINGRKRVRLILDSGASATLFHEKTIAGMDLPVVGTMPARGVAGFEKVALVRTDSISLGPLSLYGQIGGSADLSVITANVEDSLPFGGAIGYDFLSRYPIMIDYARSVLVVYDPDRFEPPTTGVTIPFDLTMQVPTVEADLGGAKGKFLVDMGNALGLIVHEQFAAEHKLEERLKAAESSDRMIGGVGGGTRGRTLIAPEFTVGSLTLKDIPVIVAEGSQGITGSHEIDGNIGAEVFRTYRVVFDYQRHQLHLLPLSD